MQQFNFFATWNDDWGMLQAALSCAGAVAIPDVWYEEQSVDVYTTVDGLKDAARKRRPVFLVRRGAALNLESGVVAQEGGPRNGWYRVRAASLAECVIVTLPACFVDEGFLCMRSGNLFVADEYLDAAAGQWRRPSGELKSFYREVKRCFVQKLAPHRVDKRRRIWIGEEATRLVRNGEARILDRTPPLG